MIDDKTVGEQHLNAWAGLYSKTDCSGQVVDTIAIMRRQTV